MVDLDLHWPSTLLVSLYQGKLRKRQGRELSFQILFFSCDMSHFSLAWSVTNNCWAICVEQGTRRHCFKSSDQQSSITHLPCQMKRIIERKEVTFEYYTFSRMVAVMFLFHDQKPHQHGVFFICRKVAGLSLFVRQENRHHKIEPRWSTG